jgi:hypothetical protein
MLHRQSFVLALGIAALFVGTLEAQQSVMDESFFAAGPPPAGQAPLQDPQQSLQKENWWQRWKRDYHRNQCWPEPFIAGDRAAVIEPFNLMAANAWQRQLLLSDYHFVQGTTELNDAGKHKLAWIISKAPAQRRAVYVERLLSDKMTAERMIAVRRAMAVVAPDYAPLPVYGSNLSPGEWSGESAVATQKGADTTLPAPRLPTAARTAISQ